MRSGGKAQTKKLIQQKHRIRQQQNQQLAPFNAQQFQEFMRVRWYLTNQVLTITERNLSEIWLTTLLDDIIAQRIIEPTKVQCLDLTRLIRLALIQLIRLDYQYYLMLAKLGPKLLRFIKKEFTVNAYFTLDCIPSNKQFNKLISDVLAQKLSHSQGVDNRFTAQYQALFWQDNQLVESMIVELYRGQMAQPVILESKPLLADNNKIKNLEEKLKTALRKDMPNIGALDAICNNTSFLTALIYDDPDLLLISPTAIVIESWKPTNETFLGIGNQLQVIVKTIISTTNIDTNTWHQFDRILAVCALNTLKN